MTTRIGKKYKWPRENRNKYDRAFLKTPEGKEANRLKKNAQKKMMRDASGDFCKKEFSDLCDLWGNVCLSCGRVDRLTADHIIPLSIGGDNSLRNIQPLCVFCNSKKGTDTTDYRTEIQMLMAERRYLLNELISAIYDNSRHFSLPKKAERSNYE